MSATRTVGLVGRKAGMTRVFNDAGEAVPVTVIEALPNRVTQVRTAEADGYRAVQVAFGARKASHLSKSLAGHYAKVKVAPGQSLVEFRVGDEFDEELETPVNRIAQYEEKYPDVKVDYVAVPDTDFATKLEVPDLSVIPVSALKGDNVVHRSENMPWYAGSSLLHQLQQHS